MKPEIVRKLTQTGLEFMGCYRAANGLCFFLAGRVANKDYGDKQGYCLDAWKPGIADDGLEHAATLLFFVSGSVLATSSMRRRLQMQPDLLKRVALGHLKRMVEQGMEHREITLTSSSPQAEFEINDPSGDLLTAQRRLRDEILRDLAIRHARGEQSIRFEVVRDSLCADENWIQRALRLLAKQNYIEGLLTGDLRLSDEGHLAADALDPPMQPRSSAAPEISPSQKPMHCFISYAWEDSETVKALVAALASRGIQIWWDKGQITPWATSSV
jgi:hypothetical protein